MYQVYVLRSAKNGKRYVGMTSKDVSARLDQHHWGTNAWTRQNGPFELIHTETYSDKNFALKRERFLKSGHGRAVLNAIFAKKELAVLH